MVRHTAVLALMVAILATWSNAFAKKLVVNLTSDDLTTRTEAAQEMGSYYLLDVAIPAAVEGRHICGAYLEFHVDATVSGAADGFDAAPRIQVLALTEEMGEEFDSSKLQLERSVANVPVGSSRRVRVDVTKELRGWIATPASNYGLAVGALTGARDGRFTLRSSVRSPGVVAQLVIHYES